MKDGVTGCGPRRSEMAASGLRTSHGMCPPHSEVHQFRGQVRKDAEGPCLDIERGVGYSFSFRGRGVAEILALTGVEVGVLRWAPNKWGNLLPGRGSGQIVGQICAKVTLPAPVNKAVDLRIFLQQCVQGTSVLSNLGLQSSGALHGLTSLGDREVPDLIPIDGEPTDTHKSC